MLIDDGHRPFAILSSITVSELYDGVGKSNQTERNLVALKGFLTPFQIASFDLTCVEIFGRVRSDLERKGVVSRPYDLQIASIAMANDFVLVTNNTKEFKRVDGLNIEKLG